MLHFNNDYMRGAHPAILQRLVDTNMLQTGGYGQDEFTAEAERRILAECRLPEGKVHLLVGGTQTNVTMIDALLTHCEGVLATEESHINVHESGAIELSGHKVIVIPGRDGKLFADDVAAYVDEFYRDPTWPHRVIPGMVYISQPTELGTLYTRLELERLADVCRERRLKLYLDGARLLYALASPANDLTLPDIARLCDAFYIGGTKAGLLMGEAVVLRQPHLYPHFFSLVKQHGALLAKGRLLGVQFDTLFTDDLYRRIGKNAVTQALRLRRFFLGKGWQPLVDSPTNQQIFTLPNVTLQRISEHATFDVWGAPGKTETTVRFVTDWATTGEEVDRLQSLMIGV
ncbi:MAG: beta-eliminating lyase-related protein [Clostridium sp.]|nr:beta-eliminating lyase-related protein [Clostridium sp.]